MLSVELKRQKRRGGELPSLTEFFILIAVIAVSLVLLNIALIYGADYSQQWEPVLSNEHLQLALREML